MGLLAISKLFQIVEGYKSH